MHVKLIAPQGSITIARRIASYTYGSWDVTYPEATEGETVKTPPDDWRISPGYIHKLRPEDEENVGLFGRMFVRADVKIDIPKGESNLEKVLDASEKRSQGDVFLERTISDTFEYEIGKDISIGDIVDVEIYNKTTPLQITSLRRAQTESDKMRLDVGVGGNLISDAKSLAEKNSQIERAIQADRKRAIKEYKDMKGRVRDVKETVSGDINRLRTETNTISTKVNSVDSKVDRVNSKVDQVDNKVDSVDSKVQGVDSKVEEVNRTVMLHDGKIVQALGDVVRLEGKVDSNKASLLSSLTDYKEVLEALRSNVISSKTLQGKITLALSDDTQDQEFKNENQAAWNALQIERDEQQDRYIVDVRKVIESLISTDKTLTESINNLNEEAKVLTEKIGDISAGLNQRDNVWNYMVYLDPSVSTGYIFAHSQSYAIIYGEDRIGSRMNMTVYPVNCESLNVLISGIDKTTKNTIEGVISVTKSGTVIIPDELKNYVSHSKENGTVLSFRNFSSVKAWYKVSHVSFFKDTRTFYSSDTQLSRNTWYTIDTLTYSLPPETLSVDVGISVGNRFVTTLIPRSYRILINGKQVGGTYTTNSAQSSIVGLRQVDSYIFRDLKMPRTENDTPIGYEVEVQMLSPALFWEQRRIDNAKAIYLSRRNTEIEGNIKEEYQISYTELKV